MLNSLVLFVCGTVGVEVSITLNRIGPGNDYSVGESSVVAEPLVDRDNFIIPPLHVKLGLVKNFIKSLDKTGEAIQFLKEKFSKLSVSKIQEGVFRTGYQKNNERLQL